MRAQRVKHAAKHAAGRHPAAPPPRGLSARLRAGRPRARGAAAVAARVRHHLYSATAPRRAARRAAAARRRSHGAPGPARTGARRNQSDFSSTSPPPHSRGTPSVQSQPLAPRRAAPAPAQPAARFQAPNLPPYSCVLWHVCYKGGWDRPLRRPVRPSRIDVHPTVSLRRGLGPYAATGPVLRCMILVVASQTS